MKRLLLIFLLSIILSLSICGNAWAFVEVQDTWIGDDLVDMCEELGMEHNVCSELLEAVIETESSGVPTVRNGDCIGLMQVSRKWHADRMKKVGATDLTKPHDNILTAVDYLLELFEQYEDPYEVLRIYGGWKEGDSKGEAYIEKVLNRARELEFVHGKMGVG